MSGQNGGPPLPAQHVGREQTETVLGKKWTFGRWDRAAWEEVLAWCSTKIEDPRETAKGFLKLIPSEPGNEDVRAVIVREALDRYQSYLSPDSGDVRKLLDTFDGGMMVAETVLRKHHPQEFPKPSTPQSRELVYSICIEIGTDRLTQILKRCAGIAPTPKDDTAAGSPDCPMSNTDPSESNGVKLTPVSSALPG